MKLRIILVNKFFYPRGGDCVHTIQLKHLMEQNGHEVAVFSMRHPMNIENKYSAYWPSEVIFSNNPIQMFSAFRRPFGVKEVKKKWSKLIIDFKPDVVHLHNIHSQLSPIIAQIAKEKGIPVVWTLHDYKLICPAYTCMDFEGNICEDCFTNQKSVINKKCIKGSIIASYLGYFESKKWSLNQNQFNTSKFISPSRFLKSKMEQAGYDANKIIHLYNFADKAKFSCPVVEKRNYDFVYVGRVSKEKGIETLCKAFHNISDLNLIIIGDGALRNYLEKKYASENINFLGYKTWDKIKEILGNALCMIIPSEWYENNPLTIIESLALGTPVIGARIGGIPELIQEGENGVTFKSGDIDDLLLAIKKVRADFKFDYSLIQENAKKRFCDELYYNKLIDIYKEIIT